jgi:CHAT domain-containing protein
LTPHQEKEITQLQDEIKVLEEDGTLSSATTFIETVNYTIDPKLLYQSIDHDAVVIEATFANRGLVAFAVTSDGIQNIYQSSTRYVDIRKPVMRAMQIMREMNGYVGDQEENHKKTLNQLCNEVSEALLVPFADIIRTKSHVIFSVSDPLTAFPFSVLPFDNKPLVMQAIVSQVPSLAVLYYLSQRKSASASPTVSVLAKAPTEEPYNTTRGGEEVNLHMAGMEAVNIARMFATWPIEASQLSRKEFQHYVEGGSLIMHIGTHGDINPRNPLLSSISIGQGQEFRVVDMSAIQSKVNLLVFAACLSGFGKATIGSEVLGFSHVVLSTGCQAYIGSLWKVSDFGSMLIMTLFYRHLKEHPQWAVAQAMRAAQLDVLQLDTEKAHILLDQMLDNWTSSNVTGQRPTDFVPNAEFLLLTLKMILSQLDWSSPFYWAPFTLVGYGGLRFVHGSG